MFCNCYPHGSSFSLVYSSQTIPPANATLKRGRTNYTPHSPIHDGSIHFASELEYTSGPNTPTGGHFQSNSSLNLIANGAFTETTHTPTYIPGQSPNETHVQTNFTNISTDSDYASNSAPPAYDSLPTNVSRVNPSRLKPWILHSFWFPEDSFCIIVQLVNHQSLLLLLLLVQLFKWHSYSRASVHRSVKKKKTGKFLLRRRDRHTAEGD